MSRIQLTLFQRVVLLAAAGAILFVLVSQINYYGFGELPAAWAIQILIAAGLVVLAMWPKSPEEGTGFANAIREVLAKFAARRNRSRKPSEVAEPQERRGGYFVRHWRGEMSLPMSYWVNGVLLTVLLSAVIAVLTEWLPSSTVSLPVLAWIWFSLLAVLLLVSAWIQVGVWRSAGHHSERGGSAAWAFAARALVIVGVLAALGTVSSNLWPQAKEMGPLAFGRDPLGPPAEVSISKNGRRVHIDGALAHGTFRKFADALSSASHVDAVVLSSTGGRLLEAKRIAAAVRDRKLKTHARKECSSACVMILVSGVERTAVVGTRIGLHQAWLPGIPPSEVAAIQSQSRKIYEAAGIAPAFIERALSTPNDSLWYPTAEELLRARVLTQPIVSAPKPAPQPPLPLAHVALVKGEVLLRENADAYDVAYLTKRYRVLGQVANISGLSRNPLGFELLFHVTLEQWHDDGAFGPRLEFVKFARPWALALRPGARIDADCSLMKRPTALMSHAFYSFETCKVNSTRPVAVTEKPGVITGALNYPSDYIPEDMTACAENVSSGKQYCKARIQRGSNGVRYSLTVPSGRYKIYAKTDAAPGRRAYYSEFVTCGLNSTCPSHRPIVVAVSSGSTRSSIDPQDWYATHK